MSRWCNIVHAPNSPTPQEDHRMPQTSSSEKWGNLDKYDKFINELSVQIEDGWPPADHIPYNEAPSRPHPIRRRPSATYSRILSPSQRRQRNLPGFGRQKKPTRNTTRFGQGDRIQEEVDLHSHYKKRTAVHKSKTDGTILRRWRITISVRSPTQGRQHQFENSQP